MLEKHLRRTKYKPLEGQIWSPVDWAFMRLGNVLAEIANNPKNKTSSHNDEAAVSELAGEAKGNFQRT